MKEGLVSALIFYFGQDAEVITPLYGSSTPDQFDLEQAYVQLKPNGFNLPIGNWQWIKFGKFVTMHGAEVIEAKDNLNISRSLLFGYAIPFTHTGIRAGYQFSDSLAGYFGINNGWDNVKDNNKSKSIESTWPGPPTINYLFAWRGCMGRSRPLTTILSAGWWIFWLRIGLLTSGQLCSMPTMATKRICWPPVKTAPGAGLPPI